MAVQAEPVEGGVAAELVLNPDEAGGVAVKEESVKLEVKGEGGVAWTLVENPVEVEDVGGVASVVVNHH